MIKVKYLNQTCYVCPVQYEGYCAEGNEIYIRERGGSFRVDYAPTGEWPLPTILGPLDTEEFLDIEQIKYYTKGILDWEGANIHVMPDPAEGWDINEEIEWLSSLADKRKKED